MRTQRIIAVAIVTSMALLGLPRAASALPAAQIPSRIKSLRASVNSVGARLDRAEDSLEDANLAIARHQKDLGRAGIERAQLRGAIARRASALYMYGTGAEMDVTAGRSNLDEYVERMAYLEQMALGERALLERIRTVTRNARSASASLRRARATAASQARELEARRAELFSQLRELEQLQRFLTSVSSRPGQRANRSGRSMVCPLSGYNYISNNYGAPRPGGPHAGDDIAAPHGTPARAVLPGTVVETPSGGWMGIGIILRDLGGTEWWYAHLSSRSVRRGQRVSQGESIGRVGCTGNCSGPHLHFEWHPGGGGPRDPYRLLKSVC